MLLLQQNIIEIQCIYFYPSKIFFSSFNLIELYINVYSVITSKSSILEALSSLFHKRRIHYHHRNYIKQYLATKLIILNMYTYIS
jgi:hypothetical protein